MFSSIKNGLLVEILMNKKYSISSMKELANSRNLVFLSNVYTSCSSNHTWQCCICGHIWEAIPSNIIHRKSGCPKCAGQCQSVRTMQNLAQESGIEFVSKEYKGMKKKHQWRCSNGHYWRTAPSHIKTGTRCPQCSTHINEEKCRFIFEFLVDCKFPSTWNALGVKMQLDGYCQELKLAFEYNGKQHYQEIFHFHRRKKDFEKQQIRDALKSTLCQQKGIRKINIPYTEAVSDMRLEKFIYKNLHELDISCNIGLIDWSKFIGKPSRLEGVVQNAEQVNATCLSELYITAKTRMRFKCKTCSHVWESTPSSIKTGHGCIKCSYKTKRWETRRKNNVIADIKDRLSKPKEESHVSKMQR